MNRWWLIIAATVIAGFIVGFLVPDSKPYVDTNKKGAKVLVLSCIDPRFTDRLAHYLTHTDDVKGEYDLFALAGASLGVNQHEYPNWKSTFLDHVKLAVALHDIQEVWCFDHLDCGMYKATLGIADDKDTRVHVKQLEHLQALLKTTYPQLAFRGYVMLKDGSINQYI